MMARKDDVEILGQFRLGSSEEPPPVRKIPFWKRKVFLTFVLVVGVAGIFLFVHEKRRSSGVRQAAVPSAPALSTDRGGVSRNPEYRRKIGELNRERTNQAIRTGQSSIPTIGAEDRKTESLALSKPVSGGQSSGHGSGQVPTSSEVQARRQEERQALLNARTEEEAAVGKEIGGILSTWSQGGENLGLLAVNVSKPVNKRGAVVDRTKNSVKGVSKTGKNIPIIPAGKILYGRIVNELNSDHPGPVLAQAVGGKFDGVKFLGSFQRDHGALVIKFDRVIYTDGETDSIGAYAISPGTKLRSGLETDVNHHYLYRYGALLASAFLQGFGESAMYANSTSYPSAFGTPVIGFNGMTLLQQSEMGLGQAGMMLSGNAMTAFNRPTTVKVAANTPVGLLIVAETGQKLPKESSSSGTSQAKPGLVNAPVPSIVPQPGYPAMPMTGVYPGYGGGYGMPMMPMMP